MDLQHFISELGDLGVKVEFHHEVGKVMWSWANLCDLLAFVGEPVVESGDMFSLLVREFHQLQFINQFLLARKEEEKSAVHNVENDRQSIRHWAHKGLHFCLAVLGQGETLKINMEGSKKKIGS